MTGRRMCCVVSIDTWKLRERKKKEKNRNRFSWFTEPRNHWCPPRSVMVRNGKQLDFHMSRRRNPLLNFTTGFCPFHTRCSYSISILIQINFSNVSNFKHWN